MNEKGIVQASDEKRAQLAIKICESVDIETLKPKGLETIWRTYRRFAGLPAIPMDDYSRIFKVVSVDHEDGSHFDDTRYREQARAQNIEDLRTIQSQARDIINRHVS